MYSEAGRGTCTCDFCQVDRAMLAAVRSIPRPLAYTLSAKSLIGLYSDLGAPGRRTELERRRDLVDLNLMVDTPLQKLLAYLFIIEGCGGLGSGFSSLALLPAIAFCKARFFRCNDHTKNPRMATTATATLRPIANLVDRGVGPCEVPPAEAAVVVLAGVSFSVVLERVGVLLLVLEVVDVMLVQLAVCVGMAEVSHVALTTDGDGEFGTY